MNPSLWRTLLCTVLTAASYLTSYGQVPIPDLKRQNWTTAGQVSFRGGMLVKGVGSSARLTKGSYRDFALQLDLRTVEAGKGYISIHTDPSGKGYRIALNNDRNDSNWWKKTGSLLSVRNLTKSLAKEND